MNEQKRKIFEALRQNRNAVYMGSVPPNTKKEFIQFAEEEFLGNYGFALKWCFEQALEYKKFKEQLVSNKVKVIVNGK